MHVPFFQPYITGKELFYIKDLLTHHRGLSGDGAYTKKCHAFLEKRYGVPKALLTTSGTTALEMAVRMFDFKPGDEIIAPSFTFSSTVNAILMDTGLKVVFAEIDMETQNIDPLDIERKITPKTRAIIVVHYAGVAADMDRIMQLAKKHKLKVIEDAAQAIEAKYKNKYLGTIGDVGCLSFHDTKNITSGEGGALLVNSPNKLLHERAEIIREKGTNRSKFFRGQIDKYTWVDVGSSYLPSEILAAFLYAQLQNIDKISKLRLQKYAYYHKRLKSFAAQNLFSLPMIPSFAKHNAHIFYLLFQTGKLRDQILDDLHKHNIEASFHYIPLHSSPMGKRLGFRAKQFPITESVSARLMRLPLFADISKSEQDYVISALISACKHFTS